MAYDTPHDALSTAQPPVEAAAELAGRLRVEHPELDDRALAYLEWRAAHDGDETEKE